MRIFVAVGLTSEAKAHVLEVQLHLKREFPNLSWTRQEGFHLTLSFIGELSPGDVNRIINTLDSVTWPAAFPLTLEQLGLFGSSKHPRILFLGPGRGTEKLKRLGGTVREALGQEQAFVPHLTLARFRNSGGDGIQSRLGPLAQPIMAPVDKVTLYESILAGAPRYRPIKSWLLKGDQK